MGRPRTKDTPEMIQRCLHCTRARCEGSCAALYKSTPAAVAVHPERGGRAGRLYACDGELHTAAEWARLKGLPRYVLYKRLRTGWPLDRALETPAGKGHAPQRTLIEARGLAMSLTRWAGLFGITPQALGQYLKYHDGDMERAVDYYGKKLGVRIDAQASGAACEGRDQSGEV